VAFGLFIYFAIIPYHVEHTPHPGLSPAFLPILITWFLIITGAVLIGQCIWKRKRRKPAFHVSWDREEKNHGLKILSVSILYVYFISTLGYIVATPLALVAFMILMGARRWRTLLITVGLFTSLIYLIFEYFLKISLPMGTLFS